MLLRSAKTMFAILFCLAIVSTVSADDWPRWMGEKMDGVWREKGMIDSFPKEGAKVLWRKPIGGGYAGPSIVGEHIYIMDRVDDKGKGIDVENAIQKTGKVSGGERVQCLNIKSGEPVWSHTYKTDYKILYPTGPRCTATVDGDHVYTLGAMGQLICFKRKKGEIVWQKNFVTDFGAEPPPWGYSSHVLIDGSKLIVPVGGKGAGLVALDKKTGKELWRSVTTKDVGYAPLVIHEKKVDNQNVRQLIFWHADGITSVDPEKGTEYWVVKFPEEANASNTTIATPQIVGDKILISEFYKGSLLLEIGSKPPAVKEVWRSQKSDPRNAKTINAMMATPLIHEGHAYGVAFNGRGQGVLRCINVENNELKWTQEEWMGEKKLTFATAFIVKNEGKFFLFNDIGELVIARMSPEGYEELGRSKLLEPTSKARGRMVVWSHPGFSNGKMIARNDKEIICVDLKK